MKKISILILLFILGITAIFAQIPPQAISYQAQIRNSNGNAYGNKDVKIKISVLEGS